MNKDISTPRKAISKKSKTIQKVNNADKTTDKEESEKNIVLFVGHFDGGDVTVESQIEAVKHLKKTTGTKYRYALLLDTKNTLNKETEKQIDILIQTNTNRIDKIEEAILPYKENIAVVTCRWDSALPLYSRVIRLFPYLNHTTPQSIHISNDKIETRKILKKYAPEIIPSFIIVKNKSQKILKDIEDKVGFPCVIKPASLFSSALITVCYYKEELENSLKDTFKKINGIYKTNKIEHEPKILVEQLMEGEMYSVDAYVNAKGKIYFTPLMAVKTGKDIGRDDFFLYSQMTPTNLDANEIESAHNVSSKAIHTFGIASSSVHVELYKTKEGWKIIELSPRVGGYRQEILNHAFGINHVQNDILNHLGIAPKIKPTKKRHCVLLKFWPNETGTLKSVKGYQKISEAKFVVDSIQNKKPGDKIGPAKYGDPSTCMLYLVADTHAKLMGNIRKVEKTIDIIIE